MPNDQAFTTSAGTLGDASTELSANRTAMSFERTAMSSDRTLMATVRTSLSLIGFGFTIFQFFHTLHARYVNLPDAAPRRFGFALILLGLILLALGLADHKKQTAARRQRRLRLYEGKLIHHVESARPSSAFIIAVMLFIVGLLALLSVGLRIGPF
jgi:putative membrane protein